MYPRGTVEIVYSEDCEYASCFFVCVFVVTKNTCGIGLLRSNVQLWERGQGSGIVFKLFHPVAV